METVHAEEEETVEQDIDKELADLAKKDAKKSFARLELVFKAEGHDGKGMKAIVFIRILDETISPTLFVKHLFKEMKSTGVVSSRFIARIFPIEYTCYAHVEEVLDILKEAIPEVFTEERKGSTVKLVIHRHC